LLSFGSFFGPGSGTSAQPVWRVGAAVGVPAGSAPLGGFFFPLVLSLPQPAARRATQARATTGRLTAGKDNAPAVPIAPAVNRYDHILLDLDGCVWVGDDALPGAVDAVAALRTAGKSVLFLTNDVRHSPEAFVRKLWRLGFQAALDEVLSVGAALQFALAERHGHGTAYVVGSQALVDHVADAGLRIVNGTRFAARADVVVVGGHDALVFEELKLATQAVLRGADLIGATRDPAFPMPDGLWPGTGAVLAAVETATGRHAAFTVGKPEPPMYDAARDRLGPGRVLAVGARLDVDVAGARRAGMDSALVLTGASTRAEADAAEEAPTHVADSLAALVLGS
jgi:HAD superfamily hydrolase (TIGR01450 family)